MLIDTTDMSEAERLRYCGMEILWADWESTRSYLTYRDALFRELAEGAVRYAKEQNPGAFDDL